MKTIKYLAYSLSLLLLISGCKQEDIDLQDPCAVDPENCAPDTSCEDAEAGTANFTKFVVLGNSYTAGFQAGALFTKGQQNSLGAIVANQLKCVNTELVFNQPDINSVNGYNLQSSAPPTLILGRLFLFDPDGSGPRTPAPAAAGMPATATTCPSAVNTPASPAPYNTADLPAPYAGDKAKLNNFSVPLIQLGQALIKETGGPSTANPYYNPLYARFASNPGSSKLIEDALGAAGSFYLVWLGFDDVLLYAATGADGTYPMTGSEDFAGYYSQMISSMLGANPIFKGVVGNIPDFTSLPYFYTVAWNQITLDATTAGALKTNLADKYNGFLTLMVANGIISEEEKTKRTLNYVAGKNPILLTDETLTDLSTYMTGEAAALAPYARARQTTAQDLVPLAAGSVLGTCYMNSPNAVFGVSFPVADKYILIPSETQAILARTADFNAAINAAVEDSDGRLTVADVRSTYNAFVAAKGAIQDNVYMTPNFAPPTGIFSEDGLHPNSRGYAFTANIFIDAINAKFGSSIPKAKLGNYGITALPVSPPAP
ncbi:SGNH/GDSL hydrolase family protein [Pseudochryseolinea flava]|uniref:G-D-S-L family lipolytic protein n=1 Tax=Pseudochryseolinea flava TaxID=2059302 RepID=A0A364XV05_9BACT|nr:hypothetical protein [Pseudochryseolinea flava]RAV98097.1 hypothetical protein DQQ10_25530 [Pseudochryseolinea flava]